MLSIRIKRFVCLFAAVLGGLAALAAAAQAAGPATVSTPIAQSPAQVRAFWTPQRLRDAQPVGLPPAAGESVAAMPPPSVHERATEIPPSSGVAPYKREAGAETSFPQSVHGKVFFVVPATDDHPDVLASCSGTVVASRLQDVVFTAGHCAQYPGEPPSTNFLFVPGYRDGSEPFGEYPAIALLEPSEWVTDGDISHDFAIAQLASPIEATLGARGIAFNKAPNTSYSIYGYPAEPSPPYDGERLIECDASFLNLEYSGSHPFSTVASPCDMGPGASGGGWVNPAGDVVSVSSHIYEDPQLADQIVGPYFGDAAKRLYNSAGGSAQCPPAKRALKKARKHLRKARRVMKRSSSKRAKRRLRRAHRRVGKARGRRHAYC